MKTIFSSLIVLVLIVLPTYILSQQQQFYNPLTQVLFDLLLFAASLWFALTISNKEAKKNATAKWLPAAETACNELLTMSADINRLRLRQGKVCQAIEPILPYIPSEILAPVKHLIRMRCEECAGNLTSVQNHVDNCYRNWEVFISTNCEQKECEYINARLSERREMLEATVSSSSSDIQPRDTSTQSSAYGNPLTDDLQLSSDSGQDAA